jgi:IS30 family transposase
MYIQFKRQEKDQIHSLLKAKQTISRIARLLGRSRSTISLYLSRGRAQRSFCCVEQSCIKASEKAQHSRNPRLLDPKVWADVDFYLGIQSIPEQIAGKVAVSHASVYCMCMRKKPLVVVFTPTCAVKSFGASATSAGVTGAGKSRTAARSARDQATWKIASKWTT